MDYQKLHTIYQKIAENVIETIPEDWLKVYLYGEITEGVQKSYFFYYPVGRDKPVYSHDIPELFDMNEDEYDELWYQLLDLLEELWYEFKNNGQEPWTNLTFILDNQGNLKIDFDYEDLSNADDYERSIIWRYKYLDLTPDDEDDKEFLEGYLKNSKAKNE